MDMNRNYFKRIKVLIAALAIFPALAACGPTGPTGVSSTSSMSHNSGADCRSCHNLAYAGTIVSSKSGSAVVSGVKVTVSQSDGTVITMVSDQTGNFYSYSGSPEGGYSARVEGNRTQMVQHPTHGGCNATGCHDGRSASRIYVD